MTTDESQTRFLQLAADAGLEWYVKGFGGQYQPMFDRLDAAFAEYEKKFADFERIWFPKQFSFADIFEQQESNPHRVNAFLQALARNCSPEMLAMVWAVLMGAEIERVTFEYVRKENISFHVHLRVPSGGPVKEFASRLVWDVAVLGHIGLMLVDDKPILDGFYALRLAARGENA